MIRLIKRYGSRKLYDTEESRYASLEEIATWIRAGQEVRVIDNKSAEDVTVQTLGQIITEEGRRGTTLFPTERLHDLIRTGEEALTNGVEHLQQGVGRLLQRSIEKVGPVKRMRAETIALRERLEELEASLARIEASGAVPTAKRRRKTAAKKAARTTRRPRGAGPGKKSGAGPGKKSGADTGKKSGAGAGKKSGAGTGKKTATGAGQKGGADTKQKRG